MGEVRHYDTLATATVAAELRAKTTKIPRHTKKAIGLDDHNKPAYIESECPGSEQFPKSTFVKRPTNETEFFVQGLCKGPCRKLLTWSKTTQSWTVT